MRRRGCVDQVTAARFRRIQARASLVAVAALLALPSTAAAQRISGTVQEAEGGRLIPGASSATGPRGRDGAGRLHGGRRRVLVGGAGARRVPHPGAADRIRQLGHRGLRAGGRAVRRDHRRSPAAAGAARGPPGRGDGVLPRRSAPGGGARHRVGGGAQGARDGGMGPRIGAKSPSPSRNTSAPSIPALSPPWKPRAARAGMCACRRSGASPRAGS